jgi:hypothetical protein
MLRQFGAFLDRIAISHIFAASQKRARRCLFQRETPDVEKQRLLVHATEAVVAGAIETVPPTTSALRGATDELHTTRAQLHRPVALRHCRKAQVAPAEAQLAPTPDEPHFARVLPHAAASRVHRATTHVALGLAQPHTVTALLNLSAAQLHGAAAQLV